MEIIMKTLKWFAYVFAIVFIVGCGKEDPIPDPAPTPPGKGGLNGKITLWIREKSSNLTDQ